MPKPNQNSTVKFMRDYASKHNVTIPKGSKKPEIIAILRKGNHFEGKVGKHPVRKGGETTSRRNLASDLRLILGQTEGGTKSQKVSDKSAEEMINEIRKLLK
jgi:hypothetical protein